MSSIPVPEEAGLGETDLAALWYERGRELERAGAPARAVRFFRDAMTADPGNAEYELMLGWSLFAASRQDKSAAPADLLEEARFHLESALRTLASDVRAHRLMARFYDVVGELELCYQHRTMADVLSNDATSAIRRVLTPQPKRRWYDPIRRFLRRR